MVVIGDPCLHAGAFAYADDMVFVSSLHLSYENYIYMLSICDAFASFHGLKFNASKNATHLLPNSIYSSYPCENTV